MDVSRYFNESECNIRKYLLAVIALTSPLERLSDQMYMIIMMLVLYQRIKHLLILVVVFVLNWSLLSVYRISVDIFTRKRLSLEQAKKSIISYNIPPPSYKNPHFQDEARCTTFLLKMSFICMRMKNDFHIKGWAPTLVLKQRPGGTRKWPNKPN